MSFDWIDDDENSDEDSGERIETLEDEVKSLTRELAEKEKRVEELEEQLDNSVSEEKLQEKVDKIRQLEEDIDEKEGTIEEKEERIQDLEEELAEKEETIAEQSTQITRLETSSEFSVEEKEKLEDKIEEKNKRIGKLESIVERLDVDEDEVEGKDIEDIEVPEEDEGLVSRSLIIAVVIVMLLFSGVVVAFAPGLVPGVDTSPLPNSDVRGDQDVQAEEITQSEVENAIHQEVNEVREEQGLNTLSQDEALTQIARQHSENMAENDYLAHEDGDENTYSDRYEQAGYECQIESESGGIITGGENIALSYYDTEFSDGEGTERYTSPEQLAEGVVSEWANSSSHNGILYNENWSSEGVGVAITESNEVYVTQNFC